MAVNYPASVDTFPVPALPEATSLSSAGSSNPGRAHTDHHRDLGLGLTAVMTNAALKTHAHTGADGTPKLVQANTHESVDTDTPGGIHHTLGTGENQAARGDHTHDYNGASILNKPYLLCTSITRPVSPYPGLRIYEIDTNRERVWAQLPDADAPSWRLVSGSPQIPICRLRQNVAQTLAATGSIVEWDEQIEDNFDYWTLANKTDIVIKEPGLYQIEAALQWNSERVPDQAHLIFCINGEETTLRKSQYMRGNTFVPNFSQTLALEGKLRFENPNDVFQLKAKYKSPSGFIGFLLSFFDGAERIKSRVDLNFIGP